MNIDLKILYAENSDGDLTHIDTATKSDKYICPECRNPLLVRTSKLSPDEKYYRRPHYAHKKDSNCAPETLLHNLFKRRTVEYIQNKINSKCDLEFTWVCKVCSGNHMGNLLKKVCSVKLEHSLEQCKPDIALFDADDNVIAVIEVVVTHKPEDYAIDYYKNNNIILIRIDLHSFDDIANLESRLKEPTFVDLCTNPKCTICGEHKSKSNMIIVSTSCYRCDHSMKVAYIEVGGQSHLYPEEFDTKAIELASSSGVIIETRYSKTMNKSYNANVCPKCKSFVGNHYMHEYLIAVAYNDVEYKTIDNGYVCEHH